MRQNKNKNTERAIKILNILRKEYSKQTIALNYKGPFQLLVSTILSAQCTDERVNIVTRELFREYKTPADYAELSQSELEKYVKSTGFYRNKAKNIIAASKMIVEKNHGKVPRTMEKLLELPGVARKTANIVLHYGFGIESGIAVDTHVKRVAFRLGLTTNTNPDKIEQDLIEIIPKKKWGETNNLIVWHGRYICNAKKPKCDKCKLSKLCPGAFKIKSH